MLITTFEDWRAEQLEVLTRENPLLECPRCEGEGEVYEECHCCGVESDRECPDCDGEGNFRFQDAPHSVSRAMVGASHYQKTVISDLKKWCAYTREDFLDVVAPFIKEFRGSSGTWR